MCEDIIKLTCLKRWETFLTQVLFSSGERHQLTAIVDDRINVELPLFNHATFAVIE